MGQQEGSPLFAESIANYDSRRSRGRQKLVIGAVTVCVAILLTLAIAIPLSVDTNLSPNSTISLLGSSSPAEGLAGHGNESNAGMPQEQILNLQSQRKHRTKRPPPPSWTTDAPGTSLAKEADKNDDQPQTHATRPKWHTTTDNNDDDDDSSLDEDDDGPWHPRKRKPCRTDDPDDRVSQSTPKYITRRLWWPTRRTTAPSPSTTAAPKKRTCQKLPKDVGKLKTDDYANVWWYELARIQSSDVRVPFYLISCSMSYFRLDNSSGLFSSRRARVTHLFEDNTGANQTVEVKVWRSRYPYRWLQISREQEVQINFVSRNDTYLLTYECFRTRNPSAGYAISIWSLEPEETLNSTALALVGLANTIGLNPDNLAPREFDQKNC